MHFACNAFWKYVSNEFSTYFNEDILEFGSYDINGTISDHFKNKCTRYVGVDWRPGPCVDVVGLAHKVNFSYKVKAVLSASMLEHDPYWKESLDNMIEHLKPGGIMVLSWGSARNSLHCFADAPDGNFHSLPVEEVTNFLKSKNMFIHTSIYDAELKNITNDSNLLVNQPFVSEDGYGEHNIIAFKEPIDINLTKGYISALMEEDKIQKNKVCYIINFYLGDRRFDIDTYKTDKLCYLKAQIDSLQRYKHSLSKIIFSFNVNPTHYPRLTDAINIIPRKIQNTFVEIHIRENYGLSYGAFSDVFIKNMNKYDYFIFNEDDYVIVQDNFDEYLVNKFESLPNCGYLCGLVRETSSVHAKHAGMSSGISSYKALKKVVDKFGELPHAKTGDYGSNESISQVGQSNAFIQVGYEIYDIREEYRMQMKSAEKQGEHNVVHRYFMWHDQDLFLSTNLYLDEYHIWTDQISTEYLRMECDVNSTKYFKYGQ